LIICNPKLAPLPSFFTVFVEGLSVPHLSAGEQKELSPPPGAVVAFLVILASEIKLQTYLLTYFTLKQWQLGGEECLNASPRTPFS